MGSRVDSASRAPSLTVSSDPDALMVTAALHIATLAAQAIALRGRFTWALSGGSTPRQLYAVLAGADFASIDWTGVEFFWGDERCVPPEHADSNYRMVRETLLDVIQPDPARVHRMLGEAEPAQAASAYEQLLHAFFEVTALGPPPSFDLILLGMGADGHTASLFPGTAALHEARRRVVVNRLAPDAPPRLTLTAGMINAAHNVLFLVSGASKAARVKQVLEDPVTGAALPAQLIRPTHGELLWMLDAAAASQLQAVP